MIPDPNAALVEELAGHVYEDGCPINQREMSILVSVIIARLAELGRLVPEGWVAVPVEPTNAMIFSALEWGLQHMKAHGVDGLSPWQDFPPPGATAVGMFTAMLNARPKL